MQKINEPNLNIVIQTSENDCDEIYSPNITKPKTKPHKTPPTLVFIFGTIFDTAITSIALSLLLS